jgi:hypothetical protein
MEAIQVSLPEYDIKQSAIPDIKWEQTSTSTLVIDATFLNNRMSVTVDLYNRNTTDLLFEKELDPSRYGGRIERQPINIGSMNNKGIDIALILSWYSFHRPSL